jgi:hypothetical protein
MNTELEFDLESYQTGLDNHFGTRNFYETYFKKVYTDGVNYIMEKLKFPQLVDLLAVVSLNGVIQAEYFVVFKIKNLVPGKSLVLSAEDGDYNELFSQIIQCDKILPVDITVWYENNTFYIPSER